MKRTKLNFIIDVVAFVGFIVLTTTGVLMRYVLPPGSGRYSTIWSLDRHEWGDIHFWISFVFFLILALHLVFHWRWIVNVLKGRPRDESGFKVGLGIVGLITVIALSVSPLLTPVERDSSNKGGGPSLSSHESDEVSIDGSMTLEEVEKATGVPASFIIKSLNLPETISVEERLGSLKREHGFEIYEVREIVKEYED